MRKALSFLFIFPMFIMLLSGCSTMHKAIRHGKLEVETKMSNTVFLDPVAPEKQTVFLQLRNTTDKHNIDIESKIREHLQAKGYSIVNNPEKAQYMIQANVLQVGKIREDDAANFINAGYGSAIAGAGTGALAGAAFGGNGRGMAVGGLIGGIAGTILEAAVELITYSITTDLQISERSSAKSVEESSEAELVQGTSGHKVSKWQEKTHWKKYQTRIISMARKINLKFEEALPELTLGLAKSISGLL